MKVLSRRQTYPKGVTNLEVQDLVDMRWFWRYSLAKKFKLHSSSLKFIDRGHFLTSWLADLTHTHFGPKGTPTTLFQIGLGKS